MCQAHSNGGAGYTIRGPVNLYNNSSYSRRTMYSSSSYSTNKGMYK